MLSGGVGASDFVDAFLENTRRYGRYKMGPPRYGRWFINHEITPSN